jgi:hypothetical protein
MPQPRPDIALRLPADELAELDRLAAERRVDVHAVVLAQLGPLHKQLRLRIDSRQRPQRPA